MGRYRKLVLLFLALLSLFLVLQEVVAPWAAKKIVRRALAKQCSTCRFELDTMRLRVVPPSLVISDVVFDLGNPESLQVSVKAESVEASISPLRLLRKVLRFGQIKVVGPEVRVIEGDVDEPMDTGDAGPGGDAEVEGIEVQNGAFTYTRRHHGRDASISLHGISAEVGAFGSTEELRKKRANGWAKGQLESSGHFELSVESTLFAEETDIDIDLLVAHQKLSDVNRYFVEGEGVELAGVLEEGHGKVAVRGKKADSWVYAKYRDLGFDVKATEDRSALTAFFTNLLSSLVTRKDNREKDWLDRTETESIEREPDESLMKFLLRSLKQAALHIPRN